MKFFAKVVSSAALMLALMQPTSMNRVEASADKTPSQGKYALLVGINNYPVKPLSSTIDDIKDFRKMLVSTFQFPDDQQHIVELPDEKAQRKRLWKHSELT